MWRARWFQMTARGRALPLNCQSMNCHPNRRAGVWTKRFPVHGADPRSTEKRSHVFVTDVTADDNRLGEQLTASEHSASIRLTEEVPMHKTAFCASSLKRGAHLTLILFLTILSAYTQNNTGGPKAPSRKPASCTTVVIQGEITAIEGDLVTVKTPDAYPGTAKGIHAQFVTRGASFKADVSRARLFLPDGTQPDPQPLAVGDHVVMVLCGPPSATAREPFAAQQKYVAKIIERLLTNDKIITH